MKAKKVTPVQKWRKIAGNWREMSKSYQEQLDEVTALLVRRGVVDAESVSRNGIRYALRMAPDAGDESPKALLAAAHELSQAAMELRRPKPVLAGFDGTMGDAALSFGDCGYFLPGDQKVFRVHPGRRIAGFSLQAWGPVVISEVRVGSVSLLSGASRAVQIVETVEVGIQILIQLMMPAVEP